MKGRASQEDHARGQGASSLQQMSDQHHSMIFTTPVGLLFSGDSLKEKKQHEQTGAKQGRELG